MNNLKKIEKEQPESKTQGKVVSHKTGNSVEIKG
jgi:hypothetical protein